MARYGWVEQVRLPTLRLQGASPRGNISAAELATILLSPQVFTDIAMVWNFALEDILLPPVLRRHGGAWSSGSPALFMAPLCLATIS